MRGLRGGPPASAPGPRPKDRYEQNRRGFPTSGAGPTHGRGRAAGAERGSPEAPSQGRSPPQNPEGPRRPRLGTPQTTGVKDDWFQDGLDRGCSCTAHLESGHPIHSVHLGPNDPETTKLTWVLRPQLPRTSNQDTYTDVTWSSWTSAPLPEEVQTVEGVWSRRGTLGAVGRRGSKVGRVTLRLPRGPGRTTHLGPHSDCGQGRTTENTRA